MNATQSTRRESYDAIKPKAAARRQLILEALGNRQMTAHELTELLLLRGQVKFYDRNFVSPRLTELKAAGVVQTVGKRLCSKTGKNVAVWARTGIITTDEPAPMTVDARATSSASIPSASPASVPATVGAQINIDGPQIFDLCPVCSGLGKLKAMQAAATIGGASVRAADKLVTCTACGGTGTRKEARR